MLTFPCSVKPLALSARFNNTQLSGGVLILLTAATPSCEHTARST